MGDEHECLDVGALQAYADGLTTFGVQSHNRAKAREGIIRWVCGERVRRSVFGRLHLWLDPTKLEIVSQRSTCRRTRTTNGGLIPDYRFREGQKQPWWNATTTVLRSMRFRARLCCRRSCTPAELLVLNFMQTKSFSFRFDQRSDAGSFHQRPCSTQFYDCRSG